MIKVMEMSTTGAIILTWIKSLVEAYQVQKRIDKVGQETAELFLKQKIR